MQFAQFAGNEPIKKRLAAEIDAGHYPHALLIEGPLGSGRRTLARTIARAALCRDTDHAAHPCGVCAACVKATPPDLTELGGDGAALSVDTIRRLREDAFLLPNESAYRVMILAEAQTMTPQAQNALLKILEEPPAHLLFILTCDTRTSLLETIRSRCVCLTLTGMLEKEKQLTVGVLAGLSLIFRDALVRKYGGTTTLSTSPEVAAQLASRLTAARLTALMEQVERLQFALARNMNNTLLLTRLCACLRQAAGY